MDFKYFWQINDVSNEPVTNFLKSEVVYFYLFLIKFIVVKLVCKTMLISSVQFNKTPSVDCIFAHCPKENLLLSSRRVLLNKNLIFTENIVPFERVLAEEMRMDYRIASPIALTDREKKVENAGRESACLIFSHSLWTWSLGTPFPVLTSGSHWVRWESCMNPLRGLSAKRYQGRDQRNSSFENPSSLATKLWIGKFNFVKLSMISKATYSFNVMYYNPNGILLKK